MRKLSISRRCMMTILATGLGCGVGPTAWAVGDAKNGKMIAREQCSTCHVIGKTESTTLETPPYGPDFMAISGLTVAALKIRLSTRHPVMSKFSHLKDQQIDDLVAYIASVKK
jgi:mono/diheme cytochrome c family protein